MRDNTEEMRLAMLTAKASGCSKKEFKRLVSNTLRDMMEGDGATASEIDIRRRINEANTYINKQWVD